MLRHVNFEPDGQAGRAHDDRAPDDRPVFHFLGVTEAADFWFVRGQPGEIAHGLEHIRQIFFHRKQIRHQPPAVARRQTGKSNDTRR